jgi:transketolase
MPCVELFEKQSTDYKSIILHNKNNTKQVKTISVEIGSTMGWYKYADFCIGLDTFGASGKKNDLLRYFNLDVDGIYDTILNNFPLLSL